MGWTTRGRHGFLIRFVLAASVFIMIGWIGFRFVSWKYQKGFIPREIEVNWSYWHDGDAGFLEACGIGVFSLDRSTATAIKTDGLEFFKRIHVSRNGKRHYGSWKATPVPKGWFSNGVPREFACSRWLHPFVRRRLLNGLKKPGNVYSSNGSSTLLILPDEELVALLYTS